MELVVTKDKTDSFDVSLSKGESEKPVVLFAAGAGGSPERYATLLQTIEAAGYTIVAPHFLEVDLGACN